MDMEIYIFVAVTGFVAAFIDAAAGGGGMISLPALMLTGISPMQALGTNKMAAVMEPVPALLPLCVQARWMYSLSRSCFPFP